MLFLLLFSRLNEYFCLLLFRKADVIYADVVDDDDVCVFFVFVLFDMMRGV